MNIFIFQMETAMTQAAQQAIFQLLVACQVPHLNQFLQLNVSREHIVADALRELSLVTSSDLKKPLKVICNMFCICSMSNHR